MAVQSKLIFLPTAQGLGGNNALALQGFCAHSQRLVQLSSGVFLLGELLPYASNHGTVYF